MSKIYKRINFTIRLAPSFVFDFKSDSANCSIRLFMLSEVLRSFLACRLQKKISAKSILLGCWEYSDSTEKVDHFHGTLYLPHVDSNFVNLYIQKAQLLCFSSKCFRSRGMVIRSMDINCDEDTDSKWDFYVNKELNSSRLDRVFVDRNYNTVSAANLASQVTRSIATQTQRFSR